MRMHSLFSDSCQRSSYVRLRMYIRAQRRPGHSVPGQWEVELGRRIALRGKAQDDRCGELFAGS